MENLAEPADSQVVQSCNIDIDLGMQISSTLYVWRYVDPVRPSPVIK